jgi:hypothetical protein
MAAVEGLLASSMIVPAQENDPMVVTACDVPDFCHLIGALSLKFISSY